MRQRACAFLISPCSTCIIPGWAAPAAWASTLFRGNGRRAVRYVRLICVPRRLLLELRLDRLARRGICKQIDHSPGQRLRRIDKPFVSDGHPAARDYGPGVPRRFDRRSGNGYMDRRHVPAHITDIARTTFEFLPFERARLALKPLL